jgi:hypothetical protein
MNLVVDVKNQLNLRSVDIHVNIIMLVNVKNEHGLTTMVGCDFSKIVALLRYNLDEFLIIYTVFLFIATGKDASH